MPTAKKKTEKKAEIALAAGQYIRGLGRRKTAVAQVRLIEGGTGVVVVNGRPLKEFFPLPIQQQSVLSPLVATANDGKFDISVKVSGGGVHGQADSVRLGIARALVARTPELKTVLRPLGMVTRDARKRERKKYGHKSARRSPQWSKR